MNKKSGLSLGSIFGVILIFGILFLVELHTTEKQMRKDLRQISINTELTIEQFVDEYMVNTDWDAISESADLKYLDVHGELRSDSKYPGGYRGMRVWLRFYIEYKASTPYKVGIASYMHADSENRWNVCKDNEYFNNLLALIE